MRILDIILEVTEGQIYSIGDSHAEGTAYDKRVTNYAHGGQPSTSQTNYSGNYNGHPTGVSNVPNGSRVIVAQGCNDAANSSRANLDSKGKIPLVPPQTIANNVAKIVDALQAKNCKVVFVLFPNGDPKTKPYYGGPYQEKVRQAIKAAVGVPVIDLEGSPLADGVHAVPSAYKSAAGQAIQALGGIHPSTITSKPASAQQAEPKQETRQQGTLTVPNGRVGIAVADIQRVLLALGYKLPRHGVDGVRGPETSAAVRQFQQDTGLTVDGDPGPETVSALNKLIASKGITFEKSTQADVKGKLRGVTDVDDSDIEQYGSIPKDQLTDKARKTAEDYLGRPMSDIEWDWLIRATSAESAYSAKSYAMVMASVLNRARDYGKNGVIGALKARNQFQAVTGTSANGHSPSPNFTRGPNARQLHGICAGAIQYLPQVSHNQRNFSASNPAAYGPGTDIGWLRKLQKQGGQEIAGSHFNTTLSA